MSELTKIRKNWEPLQNNVNGAHSVALLKLSSKSYNVNETKSAIYRQMPPLKILFRLESVLRLAHQNTYSFKFISSVAQRSRSMLMIEIYRIEK